MKFLVVFILLCIFSGSLYSQEIGVSAVKMWSDNYQLKNPAGFGFHIQLPVWKTAFRFQYTYAESKRDYYGFLLSGFLTEPSPQENVRSRSYMNSYDFQLMFPKLFSINKVVYFSLGLGLSWDTFEGNRTGLQSGRKYVLYAQTKNGIMYAAGISYERLFDLPLKLELMFRQKGLFGGVTVVDIEQPYGQAIGMTIIQFGTAFMF
ncbi:MAG: hypothetical protein ACM3U0_01695 [archaeon]